MFNKVLLPLDGSKLAEQVLPHVARLAKAFNSEVTFISVCEPEETEYGQVCRLYLDGEMQKLQKIIDKESGVVLNKAVVEGKPAEQILKYAKGNATDLIVISSHGRSGIMPWSLGSTVNKMLHKVGTPLIIIKVQEGDVTATESNLFNRILIPLDGSERSAMVIPYVVEITKRIESEVILYQSLESGHHVRTIGGIDYIPFKDRDINLMRMKARTYLDDIARQFDGTKATVKHEIRKGDAAKEIMAAAIETDCNLIALASHAHSGFESWFYGSVTHKILSSTSKSVFLVPSEESTKR